MIGSDENKGSWWSGWVQSAKDKSENVLNFVKHDLSEFKSTMQNDVAYVKEKLTQENATAASEKVKQGMTNILGGLSKALIIRPPDDDLDSETIQIVDGQPVVFDRIKARLHALQIDPATYLSEPEGPLKSSYENFVSTDFNLESLKGEISDLLVMNVHVRSIYTQIVPISVSNVDFWRRYFFKKRQLDEDEMRRSQIIKRVDEVQKEELEWDEDLDELLTKNSKCTDTMPKIITPETAPIIPNKLSNKILTDESQLKDFCEDKDEGIREIYHIKKDIINETVENTLDINKDENNFVGQNDIKKSSETDKICEKKVAKDVIKIANNVSESLNVDKSSLIIEVENKDNKMAEESDSNKDTELEKSSNERVLLDAQTTLIDSNEKTLIADSSVNYNLHLADSNLNGEPLLVNIPVQSSSSNSPTSWTNLSNEINSKEVNSPQSSPIESDAKSDGLNDDWERDFEGTICEDSATTKSTVNIQIISSSKNDMKGDDWEEW